MSARKSRLTITPFLIAGIVVSIFLNVFQFLTKPEIKGTPVIGVSDGDTLVLEGKIKVRLRQVDAPELEFCGGEEARKYLEELVAGKSVRVDEMVPDRYGRGMALVYLGNQLVNEAMVRSGWSRYHHDVSSAEMKLKAAWEIAKENQLGVYGSCQSTEPKDPDCTIKGNIDQHGVKKYYLPDCAQYKFTVIEEDMGESWFCKESEAKKEGYTKAATCN